MLHLSKSSGDIETSSFKKHLKDGAAGGMSTLQAKARPWDSLMPKLVTVQRGGTGSHHSRLSRVLTRRTFSQATETVNPPTLQPSLFKVPLKRSDFSMKYLFLHVATNCLQVGNHTGRLRGGKSWPNTCWWLVTGRLNYTSRARTFPKSPF